MNFENVKVIHFPKQNRKKIPRQKFDAIVENSMQYGTKKKIKFNFFSLVRYLLSMKPCHQFVAVLSRSYSSLFVIIQTTSLQQN